MPHKNYLRELKPFLKDFKYVIYFYLFSCLMYYILFRVKYTSVCLYLDSKFGDGFTISFSASYLEDLFAFLFLGFIVTYVSLKISSRKPEDYKFHERIRALINNSVADRDDDVIDYLSLHISKLLVYNRKSKYEIFIQDYDDIKKVYRVYIKMHLVLTNMCQDKDFILTKFVSGVEADALVQNKPNYVTHLGQYEVATEKDDPNNTYINYMHEFDLEFSDIKDVPIPRNKEIGWKFWFGIWTKATLHRNNKDFWFYLYTERYAKNPTVIIKNDLPSKADFVFNYMIKRNEDKSTDFLPLQETDITLKHKEQKSFVLPEDLFPFDRISFIFQPQGN